MEAFDIPSTLGVCIKLEREKAGLTQDQLATLSGLDAYIISQIENGMEISIETASYLLDKMGSEIQLSEVEKPYDNDTTQYIMTIIYHFSKTYDIPLERAFRYLYLFKGIDFLKRYKSIEQTLPYEETVANVTKICANNGGCL